MLRTDLSKRTNEVLTQGAGDEDHAALTLRTEIRNSAGLETDPSVDLGAKRGGLFLGAVETADHPCRKTRFLFIS